MKNYADLGGCYPPQPSASADNSLLDLHNSSYHTQPHPIIANYYRYYRYVLSVLNFPIVIIIVVIIISYRNRNRHSSTSSHTTTARLRHLQQINAQNLCNNIEI